MIRGALTAGALIAALNAAAQSYPTRAIRVMIPYPPGNGSSTHLAGELLKNAAAINLIHVPYKGVAPALTDTLAGQITITITFAGVNAIRGFVETGKLRALGITGAARKAAVPKVPTFAESGLPGLDATTWRRLLIPVGTPAEAITKLTAEVNKALAHAPLRTRLEELGYDASGGTADEYAKLVRSEITQWESVIRKAGIRIE